MAIYNAHALSKLKEERQGGKGDDKKTCTI